MDIYDLGSRFAPGPSLNVEERAALEVQMAKRQHEERLHRCVLRERDDEGCDSNERLHADCSCYR